MKPREFDEWWEENYSMANLSLGVATEAWRVAREGMIPEDDFNRAQEYNIQSMIDAGKLVKVLPVEEWPRWATGVQLVFREDVEKKGLGRVKQGSLIVPRPTPAVPKWTPKVGDRVFVMTSFDFSGVVGMGIIVPALSGGPDTFFVRLSTGDESSISPYGIGYLKPFDASKIGMKWEDI